MQLLSIFVSFCPEIFNELNETIPLFIVRKSKCIRSQYVHVPYFACTLSYISQVMQYSPDLSLRIEPDGRERRFETSDARPHLMDGIRTRSSRVLPEKLLN